MDTTYLIDARRIFPPITSGSGTIASAVNLGSGSGLFTTVSGTLLQFKSIVAGTGITITNNANDLTINATASNLTSTGRTVTVSGSVLTTDSAIEVDATLGNIILTLYTAVGNEGKILTIIKTDASSNTVTITPLGLETINGQPSITIVSRYDTPMIRSNNTNWSII